jgi:hypothetical protein
MKLLQRKVFIFLAYSLLSLKLVSMEEEEKKPLKLSETYSPNPNKFKIQIFPKVTRSKTKDLSDIKILSHQAKKNMNDNNDSDDDSNTEIMLKKTSEIPIEIKSIQLATDNYLGPLPESAQHIMRAFNENIVNRNLQPMLIKVVGPQDVGKTALIHTIAQKLSSDDNRYLEIDITNKEYDPSNLDPEIYITSIINNYYARINYIRSTAIIAFIKGLPPKIDFKKLRNFLSERQKPAPLLVLHEARKASKSDLNYHDKVIRVDKPTQQHFKEFLAYTYKQKSFDCEYLTDITLKKLEGFLIPRVQRIAEETMRKAILQKTDFITNDLIQESI